MISRGTRSDDYPHGRSVSSTPSRVSLGSNRCPGCKGELVTIPGTVSDFHAVCRDCRQEWVSPDLVVWSRDRMPLRYKLSYILLVVLFVLAVLVDGLT